MTINEKITYLTRKARRVTDPALKAALLSKAERLATPGPAQTVADVLATGVLLCDQCGQQHNSGSSNICYRCRPFIDYHRGPRE